MLETIIKNVKTSPFDETDLNARNGYINEKGGAFAFSRAKVTQPYLSGEGKLSVAFYTLQPGCSNYPYHYHTANEEVFYIISGTAALQTPQGEMTVTEGDVIVFPPNENGAHKLTNRSDTPVVYLDVDTANAPDVAFYPDSGKVRILTKTKQASFALDSEVNYLLGE